MSAGVISEYLQGSSQTSKRNGLRPHQPILSLGSIRSACEDITKANQTSQTIKHKRQTNKNNNQIITTDTQQAHSNKIHEACEDITRELLAYGASAQIRTEDGSTMLSHAVSGGSAECVSMIIKAGMPAASTLV